MRVLSFDEPELKIDGKGPGLFGGNNLKKAIRHKKDGLHHICRHLTLQFSNIVFE